MPPRNRTRRRIEPTQARARTSVAAILEASEQLLRERGFARTTTNQIAARAGVNISLVYRYFAGKEAIVGALIERGAERTFAAVARVMTENAERSLHALIPPLLEALVDTPGLDPALHRELVEQVGVTQRREHLEALRTKLAAMFRALLRKRRAELRPKLDIEAASFILQHALEASTHAIAFYRPTRLSRKRALKALQHLVESALLSPPGLRPSERPEGLS